jgi:polysaccharide pyruvyl transferase WcaK-like protein
VDSIGDYREYMALVEAAQFVVTGRYHNPILAALVGTPAITFASANHKVHGACEMLDGLAGTPYDGTYLRPDLDAIEADARWRVENRSAAKERLLELCEVRRREAFELGGLVADAWRSGQDARVSPRAAAGR